MIVQHKKAFSMVTAIFVIVIMASVGMLVMSVSSKTIKVTTQQYRKEQAILLAKSYTEFAVMAVTANDRNQQCANRIVGDNILGNTARGQGYQAEVFIQYIGNNAEVANCNNVLDNNVQRQSSELQIIIDVYVRYHDIDRVDGGQNDWITYHKRTLQKI